MPIFLFCADELIEQAANCCDARVSCWPKADMTLRGSDVRFRGLSGHPVMLAGCLLLTDCVEKVENAISAKFAQKPIEL